MTLSLLLRLAVSATCLCGAVGLRERAEWRADPLVVALSSERLALVAADSREGGGSSGGGGAGALPLVLRAEHETMQRELWQFIASFATRQATAFGQPALSTCLLLHTSVM